MTFDVLPALARLFAGMDGADIEWCVLRDESLLSQPGGDVDLLVRKSDMPRLHRVAEQLGFTRLLLWGYGPRAQYVRFLPESGRWLKVDAVWRVDFGTNHRVRTHLAEGCLDRRVKTGIVTILLRNDAFWTLLLHCLLDKEAVPKRHLAALSRDLGDADVKSSSGRYLTGLVGEDRVDAALAAIEQSDLSALDDVGRSWKAGRRSSHLYGRLVSTGNRVLRAVGRRVRGVRSPGAIVAVVDERGEPHPSLLAGIAALESRPAFSIVRLDGRGDSSSRTSTRLSRWFGRLAAARHRLRGETVLLQGLAAREFTRRAGMHIVRSPTVVVILIETAEVADRPGWVDGTSARSVIVSGPPEVAAVAAVAGILHS